MGSDEQRRAAASGCSSLARTRVRSLLCGRLGVLLAVAFCGVLGLSHVAAVLQPAQQALLPRQVAQVPADRWRPARPLGAARTRRRCSAPGLSTRRYSIAMRLGTAGSWVAAGTLQAAEYGSRVNLIVLFDEGVGRGGRVSDRSIGRRRATGDRESHGIRGMWTQVLGRELEHESDPTHVVPIEDDIEVSPLFHWWLRMAAKAYGPFDSARGSRMSSKLVGVSLYSPRLDEIHYPMTSWRPRDGKLRLVRWASPSSPRRRGQRRAGVPVRAACSWGLSPWRRFIRFYATRA